MQKVLKVLLALRHEFGTFQLVHGNARGADKLAEFIAKSLKIPTIPYDADWKRYSKAAGPIRNREMLDKHPDAVCVIAFPLLTSIGTYDMIREAQHRGFEVRIYDIEGNIVT